MSNPSFTEKILWRRAQDWLATYRPQVVAITGSTGKTIAAEAVRLALAADRSVRIATPAATTPLAVALGILGIEGAPTMGGWIRLLATSVAEEVVANEPDTLVVEVGASKPGDVDRVAIRLGAHVVLVTNVGTSHTRLLGEKESVAHEFESLVATAGQESTVILNADDELVVAMGERVKGSLITVGRDGMADISVVRTYRLPNGGIAAEVNVHGQGYELSFPTVIALHHLSLLLMGVATAHALGVPVKQALAGIKNYQPLPHRMHLLAGMCDSHVVDDTYDATPESMLAGLGTLRALRKGRRIAVLGDITDLGGESYSKHLQIGKFASEVAQVLIAVGTDMQVAGAAALQAGIDVHHFDDSGEVGKWLPEIVKAGDLVYVSGSADMQMGKIVDRLKTQM